MDEIKENGLTSDSDNKMQSFKLDKDKIHVVGGRIHMITNIASIIGAFIGFSIARYQPSVFLQWLTALGAYYLIVKIMQHTVKVSETLDNKYTKYATILGLLGLLGLISPIVGFVFALPGYVMATTRITKNAPHRTKTQLITGLITLGCMLNANLGAIINQ